jgi:site-specific recombinase XerD
VTSGRSFEQRRDHAILMVLIDTGIRRAELAGMGVDDVDLGAQVLRVVGKGGHGRAVAIGVKTTRALDRYLRARDAHPAAHSDRLWLGARGPMSGDGVRQMLERRAGDAGVSGVHAHAFRHGFAHAFVAAGGNETDLRELAGWRSPQMVYRYAASTRSERARQSHKRYGPGDRL